MASSMTDSATVEVIDDNLFESWRLLASAPGVELHDGPDMLRFATGVRHPLCNGIMRVNLTAGEVEAKISGSIRFFRERDLPALCWVTPTTKPPGLVASLEAEGLEKAEEATGMAADLSTLPKHDGVPEGTEIQVVDDEKGLSAWMDVFCEVYELPGIARVFFTNAMSHAGLGAGSPFSHYVISVDGSPVACSTTFKSGDVVGLYNVGTLPSARGRGIGTVSSLAPLKEAERFGCFSAILHATEMGLPVYLKMGFKKVNTLQAFLFSP